MTLRTLRLRRALGPAALAFAILAGACGSITPYAAVVDGERIESADLEDELRAIASNDAYVRLIGQSQNVQVEGSGRGTFDSTIVALTLTGQIYYHLVSDQLRARRLNVTTSDLNAARAALQAQFASQPGVFGQFPTAYQDALVRREAELAVLNLAVNEVKDPEEAARAYYDANQGEFTRACVRHILVASPEKADALRGRLAAGEDFAAVARAESADPGSAPDGGLVSCDITTASPFVTGFLDAAFSQPVGELGPPVQTEFGFHLIKVDSRQLAPYEEAAVQARASLLEQGEPRVKEVLREAITKARIEVNPRYGRLDTSGPSPAVVPQEAPAPNPEPAAPFPQGAPPAPDPGAPAP